MRSVFGYRGVHIRNSVYIPLIWKNIRDAHMDELGEISEEVMFKWNVESLNIE